MLDKHESVRGTQYVSIRYTERLAEAGIEPSVGSVGDSYDNALAETINGLYKTEVIHRCGPWRSFEWPWRDGHPWRNAVATGWATTAAQAFAEMTIGNILSPCRSRSWRNHYAQDRVRLAMVANKA